MLTELVLEQKKKYFSIVIWLTTGLHLRFGWNFHIKSTITRTCPDPLLQKCRPTPDKSKTSLSPPFWAPPQEAMITRMIPFLSLIILFMFCGLLGICPEEQARCCCAGVVLSLDAEFISQLFLSKHYCVKLPLINQCKCIKTVRGVKLSGEIE